MPSEKRSSRASSSKTAAATGAALSVSLDIARSAHAQGSDLLKLGLIGCGGRGTGAADNALNARQDVKLVALGDLFPERTQKTVENLKPRHGERVDVADDMMFSGFEAYKQVIASGVDIVMLATPPGFRPTQYAAAIAAGKHVFMEKPLCVDAPGYRQLMETNQVADDRGLKVVVGLQRRHSERYTQEVPKLHDGELGDI